MLSFRIDLAAQIVPCFRTFQSLYSCDSKNWAVLLRGSCDVAGRLLSSNFFIISLISWNLEVLAFSVITDECFPDALKPVSVKEILAVAAKAEPKLTLLMKEVVGRL